MLQHRSSWGFLSYKQVLQAHTERCNAAHNQLSKRGMQYGSRIALRPSIWLLREF